MRSTSQLQVSLPGTEKNTQRRWAFEENGMPSYSKMINPSVCRAESHMIPTSSRAEDFSLGVKDKNLI